MTYEIDWDAGRMTKFVTFGRALAKAVPARKRRESAASERGDGQRFSGGNTTTQGV
jgi:hypothetical protein